MASKTKAQLTEELRELKAQHNTLVETLSGHLGEVADITAAMDSTTSISLGFKLMEDLTAELGRLYADLVNLPEWDDLFPKTAVRGTTDTYADLALALAER